jgi:hypothetical protein
MRAAPGHQRQDKAGETGVVEIGDAAPRPPSRVLFVTHVALPFRLLRAVCHREADEAIERAAISAFGARCQ